MKWNNSIEKSCWTSGFIILNKICEVIKIMGSMLFHRKKNSSNSVLLRCRCRKGEENSKAWNFEMNNTPTESGSVVIVSNYAAAKIRTPIQRISQSSDLFYIKSIDQVQRCESNSGWLLIKSIGSCFYPRQYKFGNFCVKNCYFGKSWISGHTNGIEGIVDCFVPSLKWGTY